MANEKYFNYLRIYNENELKSMLINLNKYDYILKSKNVDKELLLYKFIIAVLVLLTFCPNCVIIKYNWREGGSRSEPKDFPKYLKGWCQNEDKKNYVSCFRSSHARFLHELCKR